jgi:hypothetical protein
MRKKDPWARLINDRNDNLPIISAWSPLRRHKRRLRRAERFTCYFCPRSKYLRIETSFFVSLDEVTVKTSGTDTFDVSCENNQNNDIMTVWEWSKFAYVLYPPCVIATTIRHWERIKSSATGSVKESTVHEAVCSLTELGSNAEIAPIPLPLHPFYLYSLWCVSQIKKRIRFLARFLTQREIQENTK